MKHILSILCVITLFSLSSCDEVLIDTALNNSNLAGADYWFDEPKILGAGVGFCDIVAGDGKDLDEALVRSLDGARLSDQPCGSDDDGGTRTRATTKQTIDGIWVGEADYSTLKDGAKAFDGLPIVFSWPVLSEDVDPTDFQFTLNTGEVVIPLYAGMAPNVEYNERNCIVVFAEFANRLPSTDPNSRFPVRLEIVDDGTPLRLIGPNQRIVSAVGLTWETTTSPYDPNNGPRLVGAKLNFCGDRAIGEGVGGSRILETAGALPNDEFSLYGGGDFRLRMLTTGGFSPDGVRHMRPNEYERYFRIPVRGTNGDMVTLDKVGVDYQVLGGKLKVIGLSDLGKFETSYDECYSDDADNYIDVILVGDEAAAGNITFLEIPSIEGGYTPFYNPGGLGTTPYPGVNYTQPGPRDMEPVIIALDNPMRVSYDGKRHK